MAMAFHDPERLSELRKDPDEPVELDWWRAQGYDEKERSVDG